MSAVSMVARSELGRRRGSVLVLVLMVALVATVVLTAAEGARRTSSVLDRFLETTDEPDAVVGLARPRVASDTELVLALGDELADLDGVDRVAVAQGIAGVGLTEEDLSVLTAPDARYLELTDRHLVAGRMPALDSPIEVAVNEGVATELALGVGDSVLVPTVRVETGEALYDGQLDGFVGDGPELELEIVGVFRDTNSFTVGASPTMVASPALAARIGEVAAFSALFQLHGDADAMDLQEAQEILRREAPDGEVFGGSTADQLEPVRTAFDAVATGLVLFAVVAAAAGIIAVGQAISRHVALSDQVAGTTRMLGMSRAATAAATTLPAVLAASVGTICGALVAVLLSPRFPISVARRAEISNDIRVEWPVLLVGSGAIILAAGGWAAVSAWRQARLKVAARGPVASLRWAGARRRLNPVAALGFGSVLGGRAAMQRTRAGTAIAGAVIGVAGVMGIALFTVSQREAVADGARYGWTWDAAPDMFAEDPLPVVGEMVEDPRIESVGGLFSDPMLVDGELTWSASLFVAGGTIELTYLDGRAPQSPDEIAMGRTTMSDNGMQMGDSVVVEGDSGRSAELTVVGQVVVPNDSDEPGRGVILSVEGFEALTDEFYQQQLLLGYPDGVDPAEMEEQLEADYPVEFSFYAYANPPESLSQLGRMRPTLVALAVFMGVLGVVGLLHFLLLSTRRRRGEIAVLKAIGLVKRQVRAVVAWQAATVALIGVVFGLPLGLIIGRWAWVAAVDQIGMVDTPTVPWVVVSVITVVAVVGAAVLAVLPGWMAARRSPADSLWAE